MIRDTRPISWIKAARKSFDAFPEGARERIAQALMIAAEEGKADIAKPLAGLGTGIFEIALAYRSDAYRAVYIVQIGQAIWVVHAFQKKSRTGIKTPKSEIDLIRKRIVRLKEMLK